jgi:hypothetical protein
MKKLALPILLGFGVTLALLVGQRMSADAMAVVIGVSVGVAASIPTSLLLVAMLRRERPAGWRADPPEPQRQFAPPQPQIIVMDPAQWRSQQASTLPAYPPMPPQFMEEGGMRRLRVVGDEDEWHGGQWSA